MSIKHDLMEEFKNELKQVSKLNVGTEEYKIGVEGLTKIADRIIEIEKVENDSAIKWESQNIEKDHKALQLKAERKERAIQFAIDIVRYGGGLGFAAWAFVKSMNFEKTGTLTTPGGREALRSLLRFRF